MSKWLSCYYFCTFFPTFLCCPQGFFFREELFKNLKLQEHQAQNVVLCHFSEYGIRQPQQKRQLKEKKATIFFSFLRIFRFCAGSLLRFSKYRCKIFVGFWESSTLERKERYSKMFEILFEVFISEQVQCNCIHCTPSNNDLVVFC